MTTHIQAAIEALTDEFIDNACYDYGFRDFPSAVQYDRAIVRAVFSKLAALQAAPAQGSIDTPDEREAFEATFRPATPDGQYWMRRTVGGRYKNASTQSAWQGWQARAHIAQRAAPAIDAMSDDDIWHICGKVTVMGGGSLFNFSQHEVVTAIRASFMDPDSGREYEKAQRAASGGVPTAELAAKIVENIDTDDEHRYMPGNIAYELDRAASAIRKLAPAPIADEVADIFGPQVWSKEAEMRKSWEKIGAPDAPVGDLPPLPEPWRYYDIEGYSPEHMRAYVLADRAARAAAAPADGSYIPVDIELPEGDNREIKVMWNEMKGGKLCLCIKIIEAVAPAGHAEPVAVQKNPHFSTFPERIYLQVGDCNEDETSGYAEMYRESEITWCDSSVDRYDVAYVRADLAAPVAAEPEAKE